MISDGESLETYKMNLPIGFGKSKEFVYGSSVMSPIGFVMDVNGSSGPNTETIDNKMHDIREFGGAGFSPCPGCFDIKNVGSVKYF